MTTALPPIQGSSMAPHRRPIADIRPTTPRAPEWPGLTQREIRQIILDVLG